MVRAVLQQDLMEERGELHHLMDRQSLQPAEKAGVAPWQLQPAQQVFPEREVALLYFLAVPVLQERHLLIVAVAVAVAALQLMAEMLPVRLQGQAEYQEVAQEQAE